VPPVVLEQPRDPPLPAAVQVQEDAAAVANPTTLESVHWSLITTSMRREAIAYVFLHLLGAPAEKDWSGHDGTISKIRKILEIS
jgi:hypothetical protein